MNEFVILKCLDHKQRKVDAPRPIALEDWVAHVSTPHGQSLTFALFEIAPAYYGPPRFALEDSTARFHLIIQVCEPCKPGKKTKDPDDRFEKR